MVPVRQIELHDFTLQDQALRVFQKISTLMLRVVFFEKVLHCKIIPAAFGLTGNNEYYRTNPFSSYSSLYC